MFKKKKKLRLKDGVVNLDHRRWDPSWGVPLFNVATLGFIGPEIELLPLLIGIVVGMWFWTLVEDRKARDRRRRERERHANQSDG
jgi:hypothetical protein